MKTVIYNVFLAIALSKTTEGALMKKPMGIKMCKRECQCLKGCNGVRYDIRSMQCTPLMDPPGKLKDSPLIINKTGLSSKDSSCLLSTCSQGEESVMNRHRQPVCVPHEESSWLLAVPHNAAETTAFKVNLNTKEIKPLPFIWTYVLDFLPVPREKKYLISFMSEIVSSPMNKFRQTKILRGMGTHLMCLDGKRSLVFRHSEKKGRLMIGRMNTYGRENRNILHLEADYGVSMIDIDPDEKKLYIMTERGLVRMKYDGKDRKILIHGNFDLKGVRYHLSKGELYIHDDRTRELMRATRQKKVRVRIIETPFKNIRSAALHSGVLYYSGVGKDEISSIRIDEKYPTVVTYPLAKTAEKRGWLLHILP